MGCITPAQPAQSRYHPPRYPNSNYQQPAYGNFNPQLNQPQRYPPPNLQPTVPNTQPNHHNPHRPNGELAYNEADMRRRYGNHFQKNQGQTIDVKIPTSNERIKFTITKQPVLLLPFQTGNYQASIVKNLCFQEKMTWLRIQVEKLRISWETGCEWLQVNREDVIMSSYQSLQGINLRKEVKIRLNGEIVDDAGGVLREWMHLCVKDIFNSEIPGLFKLCHTDQTAYRFIVERTEKEGEDQYRMEVCRLLGVVIGKALFDRVPLDCFLTRSIWRQVCGQETQFCDFYSYDREMYNNWKHILDNPGAEELELTFTYFAGEAGKQEEVELKPNGSTILVTDANKKEYIHLLMDYLCARSCQRYVKQIKEAINSIIPLELLSVFEPHEVEMLLNGPQNIDVQDWKRSTLYMSYTPTDPQVTWFWKYVQSLNQQKLGNLLHFVTGSRRVPILGFSFLESNRNKINKFTIQRVEVDKHNPYPKGHTCFNRLELPAYQNQAELVGNMEAILASEINSFGMS